MHFGFLLKMGAGNESQHVCLNLQNSYYKCFKFCLLVCLVNVAMQLLIGYETGLIVLWDLREKTAEFRYNSTEVCIKCSFFCNSSATLHSWIYEVIPNPPQLLAFKICYYHFRLRKLVQVTVFKIN